MPAGTSSPPTGLVLPLLLLLLISQIIPNKHHQTPWSTGLGFSAQLSAPETCQALNSPPGRRVAFPESAPIRASIPNILPCYHPSFSRDFWGIPGSLQSSGLVVQSVPAPGALRSWAGLLAAAPFPHCRISAASPGHGARPFPL